MAFSRYTLSSPKALFASLRARARAPSRSSARATRRRPLPPPPAAAFNMTGNPIRSASRRIAWGSPWASRLPGTTGTPASTATRRADVFSPIRARVSLLGPMKAIPRSSQACAKLAFSARKPYPGWTASAPDTPAISRMRSIRR
jgi:hypothetical protein